MEITEIIKPAIPADGKLKKVIKFPTGVQFHYMADKQERVLHVNQLDGRTNVMTSYYGKDGKLYASEMDFGILKSVVDQLEVHYFK